MGDLEKGVLHARGLAVAAAPGNHGAKRSGSAWARTSEKSPAGSLHSAIGVQPPASSSTRAPRSPYLWLFSAWIDDPPAKRKRWPGDLELDVARGDQMDLDPRQYVVPARLVAERVDRNVAVELAVDPRRAG